MNIYLIRHGQTHWNAEGRWQGEADIELDELGMRQAEKLAERFKESEIEYIYASPLSRAKYTAEAVAAKRGLEITYRDDLKEINVGAWSGLKIPEAIARYPAEIDIWENEPHRDVGLGVESYGALQNRAVGALKEICGLHAQDGGDSLSIAIITHGAWIRAAVAYIMQIPLEKRMCFDVDNTSVSIVNYKHEKDKYKMVLLNDIGHL